MSAGQTAEAVPMLVGGHWEASALDRSGGVQSLDRPGNRTGAAGNGGGCRSGRRGRRECLTGLGQDASRGAGAGAVSVPRKAGRRGR